MHDLQGEVRLFDDQATSLEYRIMRSTQSGGGTGKVSKAVIWQCNMKVLTFQLQLATLYSVQPSNFSMADHDQTLIQSNTLLTTICSDGRLMSLTAYDCTGYNPLRQT